MSSPSTGLPQLGQGPQNSNGLSTSAYIGIGVGSCIGALLIIALILVVFRLGRRKGIQAAAASLSARTNNTWHSELDTTGEVSPTAEVEAVGMDMRYSGAGVADMRYGSGSWKGAELPGDGTWHQHSYSQ
jgi:hypothetical protein